MTALYVVLGVLLVFWLIGRIRVGGMVEYSAHGLLVQLRILWFRLELYPGAVTESLDKRAKKKPKKEKPRRKEQQAEEAPLPEKVGGLWRLFQEGLPIVAQAAGTLLRKIRVDELMLHLTWAAPDPAAAAVGFGAGQAALGMVWPLLDHNFDIRKRDIGITVNFQRTEPIIYARGILSFNIGQLVVFGAVYGFKALKLFLRSRPKKRRHTAPEKAVALEVAQKNDI